ncbi:surface polysaccharide O-acyltransferase-like enzyme [Serratia fonticola]|uniref:Surface polysaccharide O-acyltransferase-like enzyme n=1 Tax=Serratia fonticola TaxID=47917 RepID=A0A559TBF4_SERFO|nr:acyltransferase family protein [Serratia fonticola]TQI80529.1 surface polysaccharide O-acyltransferase-like enzyme [Serratia fonticola]TQI97446.1 surface polysaccharide O-acyltransferase-like enzyme [Serratia fonticola]TVZ71943.1 surface polysaccharide O-acyltransferase-like enzyme [Serratia fonticola]
MIKNVSQHALKSLSCFAAVTFFSTSQMCAYECFLDANAMSVLYFVSIISKPLFFIIIGYMDEVEKLSRRDIIIKIKSIIMIMIFWNIVLSLIKTQYIQQGYILQNGILLNMGIIYLIYPLILKGIKHLKITAAIFIGLVAIIALLDIFSPLNTQDDPLFISSYSFIWIWGGYYILGHMLGEAPGRLFTKKPGVLWGARCMVIPIGISMYFYERYLSTHTQISVAGWFVLEHLHLLAMSLALFILFDNINIKNRVITRAVEFISPAMVGVYIVHYSVFYFITTLYNFHDVTLKFTLLVLVFIASVLICRLLLLNRFTARIISF